MLNANQSALTSTTTPLTGQPRLSIAGPQASQPISNGRKNALLPGDTAAHDWYRFVLSFPPHLVREYVDRLGVTTGEVMLDPFCGTGTTLVECKKLGIPSIGIEALPSSAFVANTKVDWSVDADALAARAEIMSQRALKRLHAEGISDEATNDEIDPSDLRQLPSDAAKLMFKNAISPLPLHKTLVLIEEMKRHQSDSYTDHEMLALASAIVGDISNVKFGPEVGVGKIKRDAPVVSAWLRRLTKITNDLGGLSEYDANSEVNCGDAREIDQILTPNSIDAVITSPPYPNEKDYTRTVRIESVILGFFEDRMDLRATKLHLLRSNSRTVYKADTDHEYLPSNSPVHELADQIEARRIELGKTSGFEKQYSRVVRLYFGGMARHLRSLSKVLKPGARLAYVVGDQASFFRIMIRTGQLLAQIAEECGYSVEGIDLFRTRLATATREQLREEVLLLRWPG